MNILARMTATAGALAMILFSLTSLQAPLGGWKEARTLLELEALRSDDLEERFAATIHRREQRTRIVEELYAGKLTYLEAAAAFERVRALEPAGHRDILRVFYKCDSDAEIACRHVILYADKLMPPSFDHPEFVAALQEELEALLEIGPLELPR